MLGSFSLRISSQAAATGLGAVTAKVGQPAVCWSHAAETDSTARDDPQASRHAETDAGVPRPSVRSGWRL